MLSINCVTKSFIVIVIFPSQNDKEILITSLCNLAFLFPPHLHKLQIDFILYKNKDAIFLIKLLLVYAIRDPHCLYFIEHPFLSMGY